MNYWMECISEAFDEAGIVATDEQIKSVADDVEGSHENYGLYSGQEAIPNPMLSEVTKLERRVKAVEGERDEMTHNFKLNVARRHNCEVHDISIGDNGNVTGRR
jgi:hypothetical protein